MAGLHLSSWGTRGRRALVVAVLLLLVVAGACGGDEAGEEPDTTTGPPDPMEALEAPDPGEGRAVLGVEALTFRVAACEDGARPDDPAEATRELEITGEGENSDGSFTVSITRYRSETGDAPAVVTETVALRFGSGDELRGIEAKRSTSGEGGAWLDLTDPEADSPLIDRDGGSVDVRATFGPAGARVGDEGLVEGRLRARCPE